MAYALSVPGKTFLLGEYVALSGGPSILLSTGPRFRLEVGAAAGHGAGRAESPASFAAESPAGRYFRRHHSEFREHDLRFFDPHEGRGGLGASSAQYALLYALKSQALSSGGRDWRAMLDEYRGMAWPGEGAVPSGADVVSQMHGGITWFDGRDGSAAPLTWNFKSLSFTLLRTGEKLATHDHIRGLHVSTKGLGAEIAAHEVLREIVFAAGKSFEAADEAALAAQVERAAGILAECGWTAPRTLELLRDLRQTPDLARAAKGCGAMGADVIFVLHDRAREAQIGKWAALRGLEICGTLAMLTGGLESEDRA